MDKNIEQAALFDWAALDEPTRALVRELDSELDCVLKRTSADIGTILLKAKKGLPHGAYMPWLASKGISESTAWRCMQVALGKPIEKSFKMKDLPLVEAPLEEAEPEAKEQFPVTEPLEYNPDQAGPKGYEPWKAEPESVTFDRWQDDNVALGLDRFAEVIEEDSKEAEKPAPTPEPVEDSKERRNDHVMQIMGSSESPEWYTPQKIIRLVLTCLGKIDLDPCSNSHDSPSVPAHLRYTREDDGLAHDWLGKVYMNPPYGAEIPAWIQKLIDEYERLKHIEEAIILIPARIDTLWFEPLYAYPMCHIRGRLQFENAQYSAPFPSIVVYLGQSTEKFIATFKELGPIMGRIG